MLHNSRLYSKTQLFLYLLGGYLECLALGGATSPINLYSALPNIILAQKNTDWSKEVMKCPSNILNHNEAQEAVRREINDLADDHARNVSGKKNDGKK